MKKDYNYNYENRKSSKASVSYSNLGQANCTSSVLKKNPVSNGTLWHTTDTNEFFYDWNGKRTKLNLTGDSESLSAEIDKIKKDVSDLKTAVDPTKINQAISKANQAASAANSAASTAQSAAQTAEEAAAQVASKADVSYVDGEIQDVKDMINNISLTPGPAGADGKDGKDGKDGADGAQGPQGEPGRDGVDGKDGADGAQGPQGEPGKDGKDGQDGAPGAPGADGKDGVDGKSAFEIAQENGFTGTKSEWLESLKGEGLSQADRDLIDSLAEFGASDISAGTFPSGNDVEDTTAVEGGFATVQDVMDYVNALIEKKKDELTPSGDGKLYAYITGYELNGTATDITVFNPFELNDEGDTIVEIKTSNELSIWDPSTYEDLPAVKLTVDIPEGYEITDAYIYNVVTSQYDSIIGDNRRFATNPRYSTRVINGVTYNSYVRGPVDDVTARGEAQYKIIITKQ